ncbi:MAG: VTC domain-containing protein [Planctomycetes bacterium]|nr:VTC domain-containing protein [Planctomycetota bacterium]
MTALAPYRVVDESRERADLAARVETKFSFDDADVAALRHALRRMATPIRYAGPVSLVRSVYFDDARLSACRANLAGVGIRQKARVRWYDHDAPRDAFWFEVKWRCNQTTGKLRHRVEGGAPFAELPLRKVPQLLAPSLPDRSRALVDTLSDAVLLVEYRREHFTLGDARLTLDYDLRFAPLLGQRRLTRRFVERLAGVALVECKTPTDAPEGLTSAMRVLGARPARFSKYVSGCQRLGYATVG